jgi:hypothetical protein
LVLLVAILIGVWWLVFLAVTTAAVPCGSAGPLTRAAPARAAPHSNLNKI